MQSGQIVVSSLGDAITPQMLRKGLEPSPPPPPPPPPSSSSSAAAEEAVSAGTAVPFAVTREHTTDNRHTRNVFCMVQLPMFDEGDGGGDDGDADGGEDGSDTDSSATSSSRSDSSCDFKSGSDSDDDGTEDNDGGFSPVDGRIHGAGSASSSGSGTSRGDNESTFSRGARQRVDHEVRRLLRGLTTGCPRPMHLLPSPRKGDGVTGDDDHDRDHSHHHNDHNNGNKSRARPCAGKVNVEQPEQEQDDVSLVGGTPHVLSMSMDRQLILWRVGGDFSLHFVWSLPTLGGFPYGLRRSPFRTASTRVLAVAAGDNSVRLLACERTHARATTAAGASTATAGTKPAVRQGLNKEAPHNRHAQLLLVSGA